MRIDDQVIRRAPKIILLLVWTSSAPVLMDLVGLPVLPEHPVIVAALGLALLSPRWRTNLLIHIFDNPFFLLFGFWLLTVSFWSPNPANGLMTATWISAAITAYYLTASVSQPETSRISTARHLTLALCAAAVVGIMAWMMSLLTGSTLLSQRDFSSGTLKASGLSLEPNLFASSSLIGLATLGIHGERRLLGKGLATFAWPLLVVAIAVSFTRGVWISLPLVVLLVGIRRKSDAYSKRLARIAAAAGAAAMISMVAFAPTVSSRNIAVVEDLSNKVSTLTEYSSGTGAYRVRIWAQAAREIRDGDTVTFLTGRGANSYTQTHFDLTATNDREYLSNGPLSVMYDAGLVGLILVLMGCARYVQLSGSKTTAVLSLLAIIIPSLFTNAFWFGSTWIFLGVATAQSRPSRGGKPLHRPVGT